MWLLTLLVDHPIVKGTNIH